MIKRFSLLCFCILMVVVFNAHIKAFFFEAQTSIAMWRTDLSVEAEDQIRLASGRAAEGYRKGVFTALERQSLGEMFGRLRSMEAGPKSDARVEEVINRIELILKRYGL